MTPEQFCALVNRLTYKPTMRIVASVGHDGDVLVHGENSVQDTEDRTAATRLIVTFGTLYDRRQVGRFSQPSALRAIVAFVKECEEHEIKEWLRLDGRPVLEPHPEIHGHKRAHLQS